MEYAARPSGVESSLLSVAREGAMGGLVGAVALAVWFFVVDSLAGHPFYTPALLGARVFHGATAAQPGVMPESAVLLVAGYTVVHGLAFVIAGLIIARALEMFERTPALTIPGLFFLVVFFEFLYYVYVLVFVEPVLDAIRWRDVLIGNLFAVVSMGFYFWRRHPHLLGKLARG